MIRSVREGKLPEAEIEIQDMAFGGSGVGRLEGMACFVPFVIPGERVRVQVVRRKKKFAEARLVDVLQPSGHRVNPECGVFGVCGGCKYQHIAYPEQLRIKREQVRQALRRIGGVENVEVNEMVPSPKPYGYRNRIKVHSDGATVGFYDLSGHELVDVERCPIASARVNGLLQKLRKGRVPEGNYSLSEPTGTGGFRQTNSHVAALLLDVVDEWVPADGELIVDAYCGSGFFLKRLVRKFARGIGLERSQESLRAAQRGVGGTETYIEGDVAETLPEVLSGAPLDKTLLVLDPPSEGVGKKVVETILAHPPARIIYVSCDPATLARDVKGLSACYECARVQPLDMFPQTAAIEVVVELLRK